MAERWPSLFALGEPARPLAIGTHRQIIEPKWQPMVDFRDPLTRGRWGAAVVATVLEAHPDALDEPADADVTAPDGIYG
jgi:hypothetical protein